MPQGLYWREACVAAKHKEASAMNLGNLITDAPVEAGRLRFSAEASAKIPAEYVLVWMQKAQRSRDNPALDLGFHLANGLGLPLLVLFVVTDYPGALSPHYRFMLKGLEECAADIKNRGAHFCLETGDMAATVASYAREAAIIIADEGKLSFECRWREDLASRLADGSKAGKAPPLILVETESVVPPLEASDHLEWSAATIRRKISAKLPFYLGEAAPVQECHIAGHGTDYPSHDDLFMKYSGGKEEPVVGKPSTAFGRLLFLQRTTAAPGWKAGMATFADFVGSGGLERYDHDRNDPSLKGQSGMSPWLHFGHVSPVALARVALGHSETSAQVYIEQLVVRRELALNYVLFNPRYDRYESAAPEWAKLSLAAARGRKALYTASDLEAARTEDPYWNAAQKEMILTGRMHNYMRMYWGKQILAWFPNPAEAFDIALGLNDTYSLDGRDPNGYAGIAWCFGRHDRPWPARALFGTVRSMVASGLRRKFDVERYTAEVDTLYTDRVKETS
ncbi:MAG: deoxyribodipyrimidine photolyase [Spirochaetae bacterium HGW-Spirochaetae-9]|nr:MAG: deoxyribodipyrimidine photolyase [Spirochaetae bacterium HGW-Spirochaetae-9]